MFKKAYAHCLQTYVVCKHADYPMTAIRLYQLAYYILLGNQTYLCLINLRKCSRDSKWCFYRDSKPVTHTRGFPNI